MMTAVGFFESERDRGSRSGPSCGRFTLVYGCFKGPRRTATFCHFRDACRHGFGSSDYSVSTISVIK